MTWMRWYRSSTAWEMTMLNASKTIRTYRAHDLLQDNSYHEWVVLTQEPVQANAIGVINEKMDFSDWYKFRCNNRNCSGEGIIRYDKVLSDAIDSLFQDIPTKG